MGARNLDFAVVFTMARPADDKTDNIPEITPEMVEAGVAELADYSDDYESAESCVTRIFIAMMERASDSGPSQGSGA